MKIKISAILVVLGMIVWYWVYPQKDHLPPLEARRIGANPLPAGPVIKSKQKPEVPPQNQSGTAKKTKLVSERNYLESLCKSISVEEEELMFAKHGRGPEILTGLILAGSKRWEVHIKEALKNFPDSAIVQYVALSRPASGVDLVKAAEVLSKNYPQDSLPGKILAKIFVKNKDYKSALEQLKQSAGATSETSFEDEIKSLKLDVFRLAGRDAGGAEKRVALQGQFLPEISILGGLTEEMKVSGQPSSDSAIIEGLPYLLSLVQKATYGEKQTIMHSLSARAMETDLLMRISDLPKSEIFAKLFSASLDDLIKEARQEMYRLEPIVAFAQDSTNVFQRLDSNQQKEFIDAVREIGELGAYQQLWDKSPELFTDPNYPPASVPAERWENVRKSWLGIPSSTLSK